MSDDRGGVRRARPIGVLDDDSFRAQEVPRPDDRIGDAAGVASIAMGECSFAIGWAAIWFDR